MRPEDILSSLGELDDSFILQAEMPIRRRSYKGLITIGIAAAILICVSILPLALLRGEAPAEPPKIPSEIFDREDNPSVLLPAPDDNDSSFAANEDESVNQESPEESAEDIEISSEENSKEITEEPFEDSSTEEPSLEESSTEEPSFEDSSTENLLPEEPSTEDPSTEDPSVEDDISSGETSSGETSSGETSSGDSVNDAVSYDGPIYIVYDEYDGEPYEDPDEIPPNYVGTLDADKSKSLNMILSSLQTADNRVYSVSESVSNVWDVLRSLGYNNNYIFQFKSTDRKHSYEIYEHDSDGTYVLRTFTSLYRVTPEEMADIRELIKHL